MLAMCALSIQADFKPLHEPIPTQKYPQSINVTFNMSNTQETPAQNTAAVSSTQTISQEPIIPSEPPSEQSFFSRVKNGFISGAASVAGTIVAYKIITHSKDIITILTKTI